MQQQTINRPNKIKQYSPESKTKHQWKKSDRA
jgi:hypothetical protein